MIGVIDYGAGNLASLEGALGRLGLPFKRLLNPDDGGQGPWILPGVGHFEAAARSLHDAGFWEAIPREVKRGRSVLGICLGLQLLADGSDEAPTTPGLGLLTGRARRLGPGVKVPHMGWSKVTRSVQATEKSVLDLELPPDCWLYFVHGFALDPTTQTMATGEHGRSFAAIVAKDRVVGLQPHPEKSGSAGLALLGQILSRLGAPCS